MSQIRLAHQDMCGTSKILKDGNPLERVTQLGTISNNFSNTCRVKHYINLCFLFLLQACAPRYVYYIFMDRMDPVGMCFTARNNFRQIRAHRPCVESGRTVVSNLHYINFLFLFPSTPVCSCPFLSVINKKNPLVKLGLRTKICVVLAKF